MEGISTSLGTLPNSVAHKAAQNDSERDHDIATLKNDMTQIQASLAEISRKISYQHPVVPNSGISTLSTGTTTESTAPSMSGTIRVPVDTLPPVNIVSQNLRKLIHSHKYVNLALLLIPSVDCDSQTNIIDQDGNQIIVRANDAIIQ